VAALLQQPRPNGDISIELSGGHSHGVPTSEKVDLYNVSYSNYSSELYGVIRAETYGEDLGQSSWMTAEELRRLTGELHLGPEAHLLEIGSGSGAPAIEVAARTGCSVTGIDMNESGITNSNALAVARSLDSRIRFLQVDASQSLPFGSSSFSAVFSNDTLCHVANRGSLIRECFRVLVPGGRFVFTDALVITGVISHEEIAVRSSIGHYLFVPSGVNESFLGDAGFELTRTDDLTSAATDVAKRWHDAREKRREKLVQIEGEQGYSGLQKFLMTVHELCREHRLSRIAYLATKPSSLDS